MTHTLIFFFLIPYIILSEEPGTIIIHEESPMLLLRSYNYVCVPSFLLIT